MGEGLFRGSGSSAQGLREAGARGTMTPGPMSSRGGPSKWHWEVKGPLKSHVTSFISFGDHLKNRWNFGGDLFFWRSLISTGKNRWNFGEDLFFLRWHHFSDQRAAFSPSILDFTKPQFRHIWAGLGPTFGSRRPWLFPHPPESIGGLRASPQLSKNLIFLCKNNLILG